MDETATTQVERRINAIIEIVPLDERIFETEVRRIDSKMEYLEKSQERSETWLEGRVDALKRDVTELKTELRQFRNELKDNILQLRAEVRQAKSEQK